MRLSKKYFRRLRQRMFAGLALSAISLCLSPLLTAVTWANDFGVPGGIQATAGSMAKAHPTYVGQKTTGEYSPESLVEFSMRDDARAAQQGLQYFNQGAEPVWLSSSSQGIENPSAVNGQALPASFDGTGAVTPAVYNNRPGCASCAGGGSVNDYGVAGGDIYDPALSVDCGLGCPKTWYGRVEGLYMERISERGVSLSHLDPDGLPRFQYEPGARLTVGRIRDCLDGIEFRYAGFNEWESAAVRTGVLLKPEFNITWFPAGVNLSTFDNADEQRQFRRHMFHSAELNKRYWGWDVISTYYGLRYLLIDEDYRMESTNLLTGFGSLDISATNHMIGPQIGADFFIPLGRLRSTLKFNGGMFANFADSRTELVNDGVLEFVRDRQQVEFGWMCEIGYFLNLQVTQHLSAQAGYELWWLGTTTPTISPTYSRPNDVESVWYQGLSVGGEFVW